MIGKFEKSEKKFDVSLKVVHFMRCLTISCADHEFTKRTRKEKPRSLPSLTIVDTKEPSRPNLTLSDLCFESIEETDVVITPDYVNQLYNYKNFVEEDGNIMIHERSLAKVRR